MGLNDLEIAVISTKAMRFSERESIAYLKTQKHEISVRHYYRILAHTSAETKKQAFEIAKSFLDDHIDTINELLHIKKIMYQEAIKEDDHFKKVMILAKITETMIPYISAYKEATKAIIEKVSKEIGKKESNINISSLRE